MTCGAHFCLLAPMPVYGDLFKQKWNKKEFKTIHLISTGEIYLFQQKQLLNQQYTMIGLTNITDGW